MLRGGVAYLRGVRRPYACELVHGLPSCAHIKQLQIDRYIVRNKREVMVEASGSAPDAFAELALVNVDYISPSLWLGIGLAMTGIILYSLKIRNARGTTEVDIVTSSLFVMSGGILTLQGWRLDPTLMLSEGVLSAVGIYYMIQTVSLRKELQTKLEEEALAEEAYRWRSERSIPGQKDPPSRGRWGASPFQAPPYLERGGRENGYQDQIVFNDSYADYDVNDDKPEGPIRQKPYPVGREQRVRRPQGSYGVERGTPDSLVPSDDWDERQMPPKRN